MRVAGAPGVVGLETDGVGSAGVAGAVKADSSVPNDANEHEQKRRRKKTDPIGCEPNDFARGSRQREHSLGKAVEAENVRQALSSSGVNAKAYLSSHDRSANNSSELLRIVTGRSRVGSLDAEHVEHSGLRQEDCGCVRGRNEHTLSTSTGGLE